MAEPGKVKGRHGMGAMPKVRVKGVASGVPDSPLTMHAGSLVAVLNGHGREVDLI